VPKTPINATCNPAKNVIEVARKANPGTTAPNIKTLTAKKIVVKILTNEVKKPKRSAIRNGDSL